MQINSKVQRIFTHEGATAKHTQPIQELKRTVLSCLLWESGFYESGESISERIKSLILKCDPVDVANLAIEAREKHHLRHVPLFIVRELSRTIQTKINLADVLSKIIQRPDEITEFLAMYWLEGKSPISKQVKKGLARAFGKFSEYQLAKYNRDNAIKLRDVLFLVHAKPKDDEQAELWKRLANGTLETPDTWEVALSSGADKKEVFERLLREKKLGYMALLRNLRNMSLSGVDQDLIFNALRDGAEKSKALPFRYLAAARAVPQWEEQIDEAMQLATKNIEKLNGKTVLLIDISGSMSDSLSSKSDLRRIDAACALAVLARECFKDCHVVTFSHHVIGVPPRRGMALVDAIMNSQQMAGTYLGQSVAAMNEQVPYDRLIVITDEQSADSVPDPLNNGYMINVATNKNGVGYGKWTHIDGFSESVIQYIAEIESAKVEAR
ncbi:MAG: TROVE domain-containing protein [Pseudomonadota bacterium]